MIEREAPRMLDEQQLGGRAASNHALYTTAWTRDACRRLSEILVIYGSRHPKTSRVANIIEYITEPRSAVQ